MNFKELESLKKQLEEENSKFVVSIGNQGSDVVLYLKYHAGALRDYQKVPLWYQNKIKIIKEGLYTKPKR